MDETPNAGPDSWGLTEDNSTTEAPISQAEKAVAHIPPPPSDATVRTLASDLASIKETGGNRPRAKVIQPDVAAAPVSRGADLITHVPGSGSNSKMIAVIAGGVLILVIAGVLIAKISGLF